MLINEKLITAQTICRISWMLQIYPANTSLLLHHLLFLVFCSLVPLFLVPWCMWACHMSICRHGLVSYWSGHELTQVQYQNIESCLEACEFWYLNVIEDTCLSPFEGYMFILPLNTCNRINLKPCLLGRTVEE